MKIKILLCALLCAMLCSCGDSKYISIAEISGLEYRFVEINDSYYETICYDRETGVMYVLLRGMGGGISPLYNADGSVMIYDEFRKD